MEGSRAALPTVSHARPDGKATNRDHCGDRARVGGLRLGDRQTGAAHGFLKDRNNDWKQRQGRTPYATTHPMLGKAGGTVTARRTLEGTISRISSDAGN